MCEVLAEQTGVHGVIFRANATTCVPGHALELLVPALMLLRACASMKSTQATLHTHTHADSRRWATRTYLPRRISS